MKVFGTPSDSLYPAEPNIPVTPFNSKYKSVQSSEVSSESSEWDIYNTKGKYLDQLAKIDSWDTTEENKEFMKLFLETIELEGIGVVQRSKYIYAFKTLLSYQNKHFIHFTEDDIKGFLLFMRKYKKKTIHTRWYCIRKFFRYMKRDGIFNNIKPSFGKKDNKLPEELLSEEEVKSMIPHCMNIRDKALLSTLYESGTRIGELLSRKIKHITFDDYGAVMIVDGKTGMRRVRLIQSVPLLSNWIENHPKRDDNESFLWVSMNNYKSLVKYAAVTKMLKNVAKRTGIKKKIYPHLFRHSRATHLANKLTEQQLKIYFGWEGDSKMASIYVHLSGRDVDNAILEANGLKPRETRETEKMKPRICPRCNNSNPASGKYCNKCGMVLDVKESIGIKDIEKNDFQDFLMEIYDKWKEKK